MPSMRDLVADLEARQAQDPFEMGGEDKIAKKHARGTS